MTKEEMREHSEKAQALKDAGDYSGAQRELAGTLVQLGVDGIKAVSGFLAHRKESKERERRRQE